MANTILIAGATGDLGGRITKALLDKGATVRTLIRPGAKPEDVEKLDQLGVVTFRTDMIDVAELTEACADVSCLVSALQGLNDVIVDTQLRLLEAAVAAGVPRFIPSDFASDFTRLPTGMNRNFDLRKVFKEHLDKADIQATSILNGAFADLLAYDMPLLDFKKKQAGYWEDPDWKIDFTTKDNTAAFTAAAALDTNTPRLLRIASFQISPKELAAVAGQMTGTPFDLVSMGTRAELAAFNERERAANPDGEQQLYPRWQQSQYIYSMLSVQNNTLDNDRYPGIAWTSAKDILSTLR